MNAPHILALDQGTTSTRAILFDRGGRALHTAQQELTQRYPADGHVEHDAEEIARSAVRVCGDVLAFAEQKSLAVAAVGITNQRETTVVWDKKTGAPIANAIVWQDRRTADVCDALRKRGLEPDITARTGLLADPYFSATKIAWLLDNISGARKRAAAGELLFGTTDCHLLWRLGGGKVHATDATNASRTSLFNIHTQQWDDDLLDMFQVPRAMLPEVKNCADDYGSAALLPGAPAVCGVAGDQQAAAFGQACLAPGMVKSTYGTGCFALMNTGAAAVTSTRRLLTTVACRLGGAVSYALEGSVFNAGTAVQWLRDNLHLIGSAADSEAAAMAAGDDSGVVFVPAFTGLGAPHWDARARGGIFGLTRATAAADIVRAALDAVCHQTRDLLSAMDDYGAPQSLRVDGGMAANNWLMQRLADIANLKVERPAVIETTALGAALLAGLHCGVYPDTETITANHRVEKVFTPRMKESTRARLLRQWTDAVGRVRVEN